MKVCTEHSTNSRSPRGLVSSHYSLGTSFLWPHIFAGRRRLMLQNFFQGSEVLLGPGPQTLDRTRTQTDLYQSIFLFIEGHLIR